MALLVGNEYFILLRVLEHQEMRVSAGMAAAGVPVVFVAILFGGFYSHRSSRTGAERAVKTNRAQPFGNVPLAFEANVGQWSGSARFVARQPAADVFLTEDGLAFSLRDLPTDSTRPSPIETPRPGAVRMRWIGAKAASIDGLAQLPGQANYLLGRDASKWRTGVSTYARVKYSNLYPGIDLVYYGNQQKLEYDLVVAPGADAEGIRLALEGVGRIAIGEGGELVLGVGDRTVTQDPPRVYQGVDGERREVQGGYVLVAERELAFRLGNYDRGRALVIDPVLSFSTYVGGSRYDYGRGIAVDSAGNVYLAGQASSSDFMTTDSVVQRYYGGGPSDAFVMKISSDGSTVLYSTYLGGSGEDVAYGVGVDRWGQACLTGYTKSTDFPTVNALQDHLGGGVGDLDAFVVKLTADGSDLIYSTYLGGSDADTGRAIAVDADGGAYVAGITNSRDFPVVNAFQPQFGGPMSDAFVARLNPQGSQYFYATYFGGRLFDAAYGIATDGDGNAYVVGTTGSPDFPIRQAIQGLIGGGGGESGDFDAFVAKFFWDGSLIYSTFLGGSDVDNGRAVAVDAWGNAYVTGDTVSTNFPLARPLQGQLGGSVDAFVTKVDAQGAALVYSTYLGGSRMEQGFGIAVDGFGSATVTGYTSSSNFPVAQPIQAENHGSDDVFISQLSPDGASLTYSTYLGGAGQDEGFAVAVDLAGNAYIAGATSSVDFPTAACMQSDLLGFANGFLSKIQGDPR
ncbi:MAG TPA: SBBP repeat-containing protein [Myxococcaceae bacterium]|nr:SBBP repeat-containing protein [Myxococcaceae bacterium]